MITFSVNFDGNKATNSAASILVWAFALGLLLTFSLLKFDVLPDRFFYDSFVIDDLIGTVESFTIGSSYGNTAYFYQLLGVSGNSTGFVFFSTLIVLVSLTLSLRYCGRAKIKLHEFALFIFYSLLAIIYIPLLSKEFIAFLPTAVLLTLWRANGRLAIWAWAAAALTYGLIFRSYWLIFLIQFFLIYFTFNRTRSVFMTLLVSLLSLLSITLALKFGLGVDVDALRGSINERRLEEGIEDARTMIHPWINGGSTAASFINFCITLATLIIPIPLVTLLTAYHSFIFVMVSFVFIKIARRIREHSKLKVKNKKFEFCVIAVWSFMLVQSIFEPDYGSYIRHLAPFYPFIFIAAFTRFRT